MQNDTSDVGLDETEPEIVFLRKDLRDAVKTLAARGPAGHNEVRYLVSQYYIIQKDRMRATSRSKKLEESGQPSSMLSWAAAKSEDIEGYIRNFLDIYTQEEPSGMGAWARSNYGIGPVIAAGLLAHVDMTKALSISKLWSYAGLNPNAVWKKGQKRPWNPALKTLCFKIGDSFVKFHKQEKCFYGKLYREFKDQEIARNESGQYKDKAAQILIAKNWDKTTDAYKAYITGIFPPAHIDMRARRRVVKIFLQHYWVEYYRRFYRKEPPAPYVFDHMKHVDYIASPVVGIDLKAMPLMDVALGEIPQEI